MPTKVYKMKRKHWKIVWEL